MKRTSLRVTVVTCAIVVGTSACPEAPPQPLEPIKVGVLSPISGPLAALGPAWENAARLAAEEVNAGGGVFDGRPLQLVFKDTGTNRDLAIQAAKDVVDEGVVGIVGPATSGESGPVLAEVVAPNQLPMISCCATAASLTEGNSPNAGFFFRTTPSDNLQGKALAYLANEGVSAGDVVKPDCPRVAIINRNDSYGNGFKSVFEEEYTNGVIVARGDYGADGVEANQGELNTAADALVADINASVNQTGHLCVLVVSFDVDGGPVVTRINAGLLTLGYTTNDFHFLVGDGANSGSFATTVGPIGLNVIGTVPFHATNDAYARFSKAFKARYEQDAEPIAFTAQNYDAVFIMALALTKARSLDGVEIRNKLYPVSGATSGTKFEGKFFGEVANAILNGDEVDYVGPSGELTFDAFGDVVGDYVLWRVEENNGAFAVRELQPLTADEFNPL